MTIVKFLIPMSVWLFCLSCDDKIPPEEAILGKWMLIAYGPNERNLTYIEPDNIGYFEFLPNGIRQSYRGLDMVSCETYRIDTKYLYYYEDNEYGHYIYSYKLTGDRLKLTYVQGNLPDIMNASEIWIYKRKK